MAYISSSVPLSQFFEKDRLDGVFLAKGVRRYLPAAMSEMPHCYYVGDSACSCILMSESEDGAAARSRVFEIVSAALLGQAEPQMFLEWVGKTERETCIQKTVSHSDLTTPKLWLEAMNGPAQLTLSRCRE